MRLRRNKQKRTEDNKDKKKGRDKEGREEGEGEEGSIRLAVLIGILLCPIESSNRYYNKLALVKKLGQDCIASRPITPKELLGIKTVPLAQGARFKKVANNNNKDKKVLLFKDIYRGVKTPSTFLHNSCAVLAKAKLGKAIASVLLLATLTKNLKPKRTLKLRGNRVKETPTTSAKKIREGNRALHIERGIVVSL
ncbi:hypothetical protein K504DRAFT_454228 [Pleomassaria siparia CBS 279.74]|uniref:Uncharacterized protein n=1 Tax=Pleomassaria siparia CBS 279.74 TaxID=1314801 RepID=A0A6G1KFQ5_9PLEO|nr:hypothetical protein K504DRAFT_454228 [Pleomassaria siparia CBS 279.74]